MPACAPIIVPDVNVNDPTVLLASWLVERGAQVSIGQGLCIVETTKAATIVESDRAGVVLPLVEAGATLPTGARIGYIGDSLAEIERALESARAPEPALAMAGVTVHSTLRATPKAEQLAARHGIALETIAAAGVHGTIKEADVQRFVVHGFVDAHALPDALAAVTIDEGPVAAASLAVARNLRASVDRSLLATTSIDVNMDAVNRATADFVSRGLMVTPLHAILVTIGRVLPSFPKLLRFIHHDRWYRYSRLDVALVVRRPDGVLVTPVIRDVPSLGIADVARASHRLTLNAVRGQLAATDLTNAAFTVSHVNLPVTGFTALPNLFQSAILAVSGQRRTLAK